VSEPEAKDEPQSLMAHLSELRWRIVKSALGIAAGSVIGLVFANRLKDLLTSPYLTSCTTGACKFIFTGPAESFSQLMKIAIFAGLILGSPVILWQIWGFISPALTARERKWAVPVIAASVSLFVFGVAFGYWSLPRAFDFFRSIFPDVENTLKLDEYLSFVMRFMLAFGVSFLYPVFLFGAAAAGLVTSRQLATGRRWAVLIIVVVAAAITPTGDVITLTLLSTPLYVFYEATYWLVRLVLRK
jgi:sec-independent protein translocase protein TatC